MIWTTDDLPEGQRQQPGPRLSERAFQERVVSLARQLGWLAYHTYDSRWLGALRATGADVYLWRPRDYDTIIQVLSCP